MLIISCSVEFLIPKKDQCEDCVAYTNSSEEDKATLKHLYDTHLREKELSRHEKEKDKKNLTGGVTVS